MNNVEITFDKDTGFYSAIVLSKGIATQAKSLDDLVKNLGESFTLSKKQHSKI